MTPSEHLAESERLLAMIGVYNAGWDSPAMLGLALTATGHALTALAAELGVPHPAAPAGGGGGGGH